MRSAFTSIEALIILTVCALLVALGFTYMGDVMTDTRDKSSSLELYRMCDKLLNAHEMYRIDTDDYLVRLDTSSLLVDSKHLNSDVLPEGVGAHDGTSSSFVFYPEEADWGGPSTRKESYWETYYYPDRVAQDFAQRYHKNGAVHVSDSDAVTDGDLIYMRNTGVDANILRCLQQIN